jgi:RNA polymerase sigma factor (TIGR02999 family)
MGDIDDDDITALLARWRSGDRIAESALLQRIYPTLRDIARNRLRGESVTLSATEVAHETYLRLSRSNAIEFNDRSHFFAAAARATRHFVIDYMRARGRDKRGGGLPLVPLDQVEDEIVDAGAIDLEADWLALNDALDLLEQSDAVSARVVELKFFSVLTTDEIAAVLDISRASVVRYWRFAKAWLMGRMRSSE